MSLDALKAADTIIALENFIEKRRPPIEVRDKVDLAYKIENQSVFIYEIRPFWRDKSRIIKSEIAKATWVNSQKVWKVYWKRADQKWHRYKAMPETKTINQFIELVDEDQYSCFWG